MAFIFVYFSLSATLDVKKSLKRPWRDFEARS